MQVMKSDHRYPSAHQANEAIDLVNSMTDAMKRSLKFAWTNSEDVLQLDNGATHPSTRKALRSRGLISEHGVAVTSKGKLVRAMLLRSIAEVVEWAEKGRAQDNSAVDADTQKAQRDRSAELAREAQVNLRDSLRHAREAMAVAAPFAGMQPQREVLRDYMIQWRMVETVDGQDECCSGCGENQIRANVYASEMDGNEAYAQTCLPCVLPTIDGQIDTDPSCVVIVEVNQQ